MAGPQHGIMGNDANVLDLPQTQVDDTAFRELENTAKFAKSKEFKILRAHVESRIKYYQEYLPDGRPAVTEPDLEKLKALWPIANAVIGEFKALLDSYDSAVDLVKDERQKSNR